MTEDDRKYLYTALLHDRADEAQRRCCARDENHAWGRWIGTRLEKDIPLRPVNNSSMMMNESIQVRYDRECACCGKKEMR